MNHIFHNRTHDSLHQQLGLDNIVTYHRDYSCSRYYPPEQPLIEFIIFGIGFPLIIPLFPIPDIHNSSWKNFTIPHIPDLKVAYKTYCLVLDTLI